MKNLYEMEELNVNEKAILTLLDDSLDRIINEHNETIVLSEIKHLSGSINYLIVCYSKIIVKCVVILSATLSRA